MNSYVLYEGKGLSLELDEVSDGFHISMRLGRDADGTVIHGAKSGSEKHSRMSTATTNHAFSREELRKIAEEILRQAGEAEEV
jgi:hypothetical protein